jgi:hypothetical protein
MSRDTAITNTGVSVGTGDTAILPLDRGRRELTIVNDGANVVYLALGATAAANSGIRLAAGASYTTNLWEGTVRGIAPAGATNVTVCVY